MKKIIETPLKVLVVLLLLLFLAFSSNAVQYTLINGTQYTNFSASVGAGVNTNSSGVLTNNVQAGVVLAATTNYYSLYPGFGTQLNTNLWPSQAFPVAAGYPGTIYGPYKTFQSDLVASITATNAVGAMTLTRRFAGYDGLLWVSNVLSQTVVIPANSLSGISSSNFTSSFYYLAAQQDEWTNTAVAVTNEMHQIISGVGL